MTLNSLTDHTVTLITDPIHAMTVTFENMVFVFYSEAAKNVFVEKVRSWFIAL